MEIAVLSDEQLRILQPGSLAVVACPGAGKTAAIVARYCNSAFLMDRGVAMLSFTNRAINEATRRCSGYPQLLKSPNFIGTFDAFLHRFVVTPIVVHAHGRAPRYVRSWDDLGFADTKVRISEGSGIKLSSFVWTADGPGLLAPDNLDFAERAYYDAVVRAGRLKSLETAAKALTNQFIDKFGVIDASSARFFAYEFLLSSIGTYLCKRLLLRFREVIVDEYQDCDDSERGILNHLLSLGITVVTVADPDQAIYEFRRTHLGHNAAYPDGLDHIQTLQFNTNYRSTPTICALATSLRASAKSIIAACRTPPPGPAHIYLLGGKPAQQRSTFLSLAAGYDIPLDDCIVLAHRRADAARLAGGLTTGVGSQAKTDRIAISVATLLQPGQSIEKRRQSMLDLENTILNALDWPAELAHSSKWRKLEQISRTSDWLRLEAAHLLHALQDCQSREDFGKIVRSRLRSHLDSLSVSLINLSSNFRKPSPEAWKVFCEATRPALAMIPFDTIHGAKGSERHAVLIALPPRRADRDYILDDWELDRNSEQRRVLYVGVTRAQRLLAFAVPDSTSQTQLERILARDHITYTAL